MHPLLFTVLALAGPPETAPAEPTALVDFSQKEEADRWVTVNDNVMGGRSRGGPTFKENRLIFAGATNTNGGGFSSIRTKPQEWPLDGAAGLRMRVRGDGRTYKAEVGTDAEVANFRVAYRADFETRKGEWTEVTVPFSAFEPTVMGRNVADRAPALAAEDVKTLGFMIYDGKDGPFELEVDWIKADRPAR